MRRSMEVETEKEDKIREKIKTLARKIKDWWKREKILIEIWKFIDS